MLTLLFSLYTNDCTSKDPSVKLLKFTDDTTVIGLIQDGDESAYRQEVKELAVWCSLNNLELNTLKKDGDDRRLQEKPPPLSPHTPSQTALWLQWSHSDSWAPQFLRTWSRTITLSPWWKRPSRGCTFFASWGSSTCHRSCLYSYTLPSLNLSSAHQTVWLSSATKSDLRRLRRVVRTAERIIGTTLPTLQELYSFRVSKMAGKINLDYSHPAHSLFELLPSGRHYSDTTRQSSEHQNDQRQKDFLSPSNPSHEHLTLNVEHTTLLYIIYSSHIIIFNFKFAQIRPVHT